MNIDGGHKVPASISPLELLHPNGFARHVLIVGSNCPESLVAMDRVRASEKPDLIVLAPSVEECREDGWLERAIDSIEPQLAPDGFVYALIPRRWRRRVQRLFRKQGLHSEGFYAHVPDWYATRYLIPLESAPAQYAFSNLFPTRFERRLFAFAALRLPGGSKVLGLVFPFAGLVVKRLDGPPLFSWLFTMAGISRGPRSAVLTTSWRSQYPSVVIHYFSGSARPVGVAKTAFATGRPYEQGDEYTTLASLGETARSAGAQVPEPLVRGLVGDYPIFLQSALGGRCMAAELAGHPERIPAMLERVVTWLERWNRSTRTVRPLTEDVLERELLRPIRRIVSALPDVDAYLRWLTEHYAKHEMLVPFVAAHNDLTTWNILLDDDAELGIVDWKEASAEALPLVDYFYMVVAAVSVAHGFDYERAFEACFIPRERYSDLTKRFFLRLQQALEIPEALMTLCLHICFLHHAVNEQVSANPGEARPFLRIFQRLMQERITLEQGKP